MIISAFKAVISRARAGLQDLAAASLLEEAVEALREVRASHWSSDGISAVPDMIRELARDRDDYRAMAESYREQLAEAEASVEFHSQLRRENLDMHLKEVERLMKLNHALRETIAASDDEHLDELCDCDE